MAPAAALALALVVSGCSSSSSGELATGSDPVDSGEASTVQQIERLLFGTENPTGSELERQQDENASYEDRLARCMAAAGFEYYPTAFDVTTYLADQPNYLSREYAAEFGFGYTTTMDDPQQWSTSGDQIDANQQYLETLTPSEQEQYYVALYGDQSFWEDIRTEEEQIALQKEQPELFEASGCNADATSEQSKKTTEFWTAHQDEMNELFMAAESHQLVLAPLEAWQVCMAEHGHNFTSPDDFDSIMDPYQNQLSESAVYPGADLTEDEMNAMSEDALNALWSQPPQYDEELLAEAQAYEINLAVTSWDCGMPGLYDSYRAALSDLQQKFVESNMAELSSLVTQ